MSRWDQHTPKAWHRVRRQVLQRDSRSISCNTRGEVGPTRTGPPLRHPADGLGGEGTPSGLSGAPQGIASACLYGL
jgi:hypothetical protein